MAASVCEYALPTVPSGSVAVEMVMAGQPMAKVIACVPWQPLASVVRMVTLTPVPFAVVGVPLITPARLADIRRARVLVEGTYYINRLFATVEFIGKSIIPVGHVGVVVSYTGARGEDVSGSEYSHGELVNAGCRGVWREPLMPGKYAFNTYAGKIELVPTTKRLFEDAGYTRMLGAGADKDSKRREENFGYLMRSVERYASAPSAGKASLSVFLTRLTLRVDNEEEVAGNKVTLSSLHSSKGLEFPVVFFIGLVEGILPHSRTTDPKVNEAVLTDVDDTLTTHGAITDDALQAMAALRAATPTASRGAPMPRAIANRAAPPLPSARCLPSCPSTPSRLS